MPVNLSIENIPDDVAERLRRRAARNRRSLQGERLAIVEAAVRDDGAATRTRTTGVSATARRRWPRQARR